MKANRGYAMSFDNFAPINYSSAPLRPLDDVGSPMIVMRPAQLHSFQREQDRRFALRLHAMLSDAFPSMTTCAPEGCLEGIERQIPQARLFGLHSEWGIYVFVCTCWVLGETFYTQFPVAQVVLSADDCRPEEKILWLQNWMLATLRELEQ